MAGTSFGVLFLLFAVGILMWVGVVLLWAALRAVWGLFLDVARWLRRRP